MEPSSRSGGVPDPSSWGYPQAQPDQCIDCGDDAKSTLRCGPCQLSWEISEGLAPDPADQVRR